MSESLPPLVDEEVLASFLDERLPGAGTIEFERHQSGHSNETFMVSRGPDRYVLRRPPRGAFLPTAHDVAREYRVMKGLQATPVRVPRTVLMCEDESVIGARFYLMEHIDGVVVRDELPEVFGPPERARIGEELVDSLVELHSVDPASCGLGDFGKPAGYLERQLRRWKSQMELTLPHTRPLPDLERVGEWLAAHLPDSPQATIVHGDYKLDNVMYAPEPPTRLVAILDWEMSTLGDPLADLGWMISFWREAGDGATDVVGHFSRVTEMEGFSARDELVGRYVEATGRDATALDWYVVLAVWKLAILLEGSYARHLTGMTDDPFFAGMEEGVPGLARRALAVIDEAVLPR